MAEAFVSNLALGMQPTALKHPPMAVPVDIHSFLHISRDVGDDTSNSLFLG